MVGIICPLVEKGLTDLPKSGGDPRTPGFNSPDSVHKIKVCVNKNYHACSAHVRFICPSIRTVQFEKGVAKFFCNLEFYSIIITL